jgi:cyanate permease
MYLGVNNTGYSTAFFTPTILKQLGWTAVRAQVLSIPIYIVAAVACLMSAFLTDHFRHRYAFAMLGVVVSSIGYIILLAQHSVPVGGRYLAVYLVMAGGYITQPITLVWLSNNMGGHYKRSINAAMQVGFGNLGGIIASNIYISNQAPTYPVGYGVSLGLLWVCGIACTVLVIGMRFENKRRDRGERDDRLSRPQEERENLGDDHPSFRFIY